MSVHSYIRRFGQFFIGVALMALGIALTTRADLGTTPISALPYVASLGFGPSLGFFTVVMNGALILLQLLLLRRAFARIQVLQVPATLAFGLAIDFWMDRIPAADGGYALQCCYLLAGALTLALGIFVEVTANVVMMAGEGAVMAIALVSRREFGTVKVCFDVVLVALAVALSLLLFGNLTGVREGTLFSALAVGSCVKALFRGWGWVRAKWPGQKS